MLESRRPLPGSNEGARSVPKGIVLDLIGTTSANGTRSDVVRLPATTGDAENHHEPGML